VSYKIYSPFLRYISASSPLQEMMDNFIAAFTLQDISAGKMAKSI
jgi:hypothetical protein